jgi:hypothetical protein
MTREAGISTSTRRQVGPTISGIRAPQPAGFNDWARIRPGFLRFPLAEIEAQ